MREPVIDVILLTMLVTFFGLEQRRRPELYFRFWLVGWVLVLVSVLCWDYPAQSVIAQEVQEFVRGITLACGGLAFLFSFLVSDRRWRVPLRGAILLGAPICLAIGGIEFHLASRMVLYGLIALGLGIAVWTSYRFLRRAPLWFFATMVGTCVCSAWSMMNAVWQGRSDAVTGFLLAELFVASGLLFARSGLTGGQLVGGAAFVAWGGLYAAAAKSFVSPSTLAVLFSVWSIPKYLVGVGMVLTIFEKAQDEIKSLGIQHRRLYEEYRVLFMSNPHPMWIFDPETMRFLAANEAAVVAYGYTETEFGGMPVGKIEVGQGEDACCMVTKAGGRHMRADGSLLDVEVTRRDVMFDDRKACFMLAVDITEREVLHRELVHAANHDVLTGLPNRLMLEDRIEQCLSRCVREERKGALLTVDIDHFKMVNDTFGHLVGDECLKAAAARLSSRVRQVDTIARTGGEEFTIMVGGMGSKAAAEKVCAEMLRLFETPVRCGEYEVPMTISIGVALFPDHAIDTEGLRRRSDQALYEAKRAGRNRAVFASMVNV